MADSADDVYKSIPTFNANLQDWPTFVFKFRTFLESRGMLHLWGDPKDTKKNEERAKLVQAKTGINATDAALKEIQDDARVRVWLLSKMPNDIVQLLQGCKSATEMREMMESQYSSQSAASNLLRLEQLLDTAYKEGTEIGSHLGKINGLISSLRDAGGFDIEKLHLVVVLRSMPKTESWGAVIQSLKAQDSDKLTVQKVNSAITQHAHELEMTKGTGGKTRTGGQHAFGANDEEGFNARQRDFSKVKCFRCDKMGHTAKFCATKANKEKSNSNSTSGGGVNSYNKDEASFAFMTGETTSKRESRNRWIWDSGAAFHYTRHRDVFQTYETHKADLEVADGRTVTIEGMGTAIFEARRSDGSTAKVTISNIRHVPTLKVNLISEMDLQGHGVRSEGSNGKIIFKKDGQEVMQATRDGRRFVMDWTLVRNRDGALATNGDSSDIWHRRLGHLSGPNMSRLSNMVTGYSNPDHDSRNCHVCKMAKMVRKPSKTSTNPKAKHPMDLIHLDVVVVSTEGLNGEKYILVMTDDCTNTKFVFPMKSKGSLEIWEKFKAWMPWAERMTDRKVKTIRHDNAKEFTSGYFGAAMKELGIEAQLSLAYEHEQNGKAERANRTIVDRGRCLILDSGLPAEYWPCAVVTAAFLANRSPTTDMEVTPIEAFTGIKPDLRKIRVFGAYGWAHIVPEKQGDKHDARARVVRLVGYGQGGHSYLVLDTTTGVISGVKSADFDEHRKTPPTTPMDILDDDTLAEDDGELRGDGPDDINDEQDPPQHHQPRAPTRDPPGGGVEGGNENATRRSSRIPKPVSEFWKVRQETVNFAYLTYESVRQGEDAAEWIAAEDAEMKNMEDYGVYQLETLPAGRKAIGSRWVYQQGTGEGGKPKRKARFVAKGFSQIEGIDFTQTFAPTPKPATTRVLLAIATNLGLTVRQADVRAAFLNGQMDEDEVVYVEPPKGRTQFNNRGQKLFWRLFKALYGTKQAAFKWRRKAKGDFVGLGFKPLIHDECVFDPRARSQLMTSLSFCSTSMISCFSILRRSKQDFASCGWSWKGCGK